MDKNIPAKPLPEEFALRALCVADAAQLHALELQPAMLRGHPNPPYPTLERTREEIEKIASSQVAIAAMVGDILVGFGRLTPGTLRRAHAAMISLGVHEAWHGQGIGNAVVAEMLDLADNWLGLRRLELLVFADNHAALALYRKFGFEIEAHQRGAVLRRGVLIDCYFMARLREAAPWMSTSSSANFAAE